MQTKFQKLVNNSFLFRLFLLKSLPLAFIAGIRVKKLNNEMSATTVKYKWITQNPFKSMYFASQAMAAEMASGILLLNYVYKSSPAISMLIIDNHANYFKKATDKITFTCTQGNEVAKAIEMCKTNNEGSQIKLNVTGKNEQNEIVSEFIFTWSLKAKAK